MALQTKTITFGESGSRPYGILTVNEESTSTSTNKSILSGSLVLKRPYNISSSASKYAYCSIDGQEFEWSGSIGGSGDKTLIEFKDITVEHNSDGNKSIEIAASIDLNITWSGSYIGTISGNDTMNLTKIARRTSITSFTVSKRNETSLTFNWKTADTIDYVWYSTNNGSSWTGYDVSDGTSGSFVVSGLSANTSYNCKLRVRRKDSQLNTDSSVVSQTTNKVPTQSLSSKTETKITISWSCDDTVDYIWYSTNNGSSWTAVGSVNANSGTYTISGLSANTSYNVKTRIRRKTSQTTYDTTSLSITTYKAPSHSLKSKTETSIVMNWSCDSTVDYIWYSKDNGSNWTGVDVTDGTSGTYTISGLSANTSYNIKTRVRRKATQTTYDTSALSVTTYNYPYCTDSPNFTIGNKLTLKFYNPLNRSFTVKMLDANNNVLDTHDNTTGTSLSGYTGTNTINNLYASIPNAQSGSYKVQVIYGSSTKTRNNGNTYTVNSSNCTPTVGALTYKDTNTTVVNITGNNQRIVRNKSTLQFTCAVATAKNSASITKYEVTFNNVIKSRTTAGTLDYGTINLSYGTTATLVVTDSRGFTAKTTCNVTIDNWVEPSGITTIKRKNNYEAETYLKVDGTVSSVNSKNTMTIKYRYKKTSASSYNSWQTLSDNTQITLSLDNTASWNFQIQVIDKFATTTYNYVLAIGMPIMFIDAVTQNIGFNMFPTNNGKKFQFAGGMTVDGCDFLPYEVVDTW